MTARPKGGAFPPRSSEPHYTERMMEQLNAYRELGTVEELSHRLDDLQQRCASCYKLTYGTYCQECYGWNITTRASN